MRPSARERTARYGHRSGPRTYSVPSSLWAMGILDDAIREHLDLKRRRGADPSEVERLEREALGPVRRGGFEHDEDVLDSDYPSDARYEFEGEPGYAGEV